MASFGGTYVIIDVSSWVSWKQYDLSGYQTFDQWFESLGLLSSQKEYHRLKFRLAGHAYENEIFELVGKYRSFFMPTEVYNAISPLYTFNPFTEKYEGKFTLLQIWEYLL